MDDNLRNSDRNRAPFKLGGESGMPQSWWQRVYAPLKRSQKWRWMVPWSLAAMGVAVTIAWIFQPTPQPQQFSRPGPGGGGRRGGGAAQRAAPNATPAARVAGADLGTAVGAAVTRVGDIDVTLNALGTVTAAAVVTIKPQISGQLQKVAFQEGQMVQKGDFIAQIDPRNYEIALATGKANLERDKILLENAKRDLERYQEMIKENAVSQQQVETQRATVGQNTAAVAADESQIATATLNLSYCHIVAPISGRIGLRQVDEGNYVTAGETNGIGVIAQINPITVVFTLPEDSLPQIQGRLSQGASLSVEAYDRANATKLATGKLLALDNIIDVSTGTVRLKASFENQSGSLFPNQFVNVHLLVDTIHNATVLPPTAIQHGAPGAFVFLIKPDDTVGIQPVKTGVSTATLIQVLSGVNAGDQVVVDGVDRLREGSQVYVPNPPTDPLAPIASTDSTTPDAKPAAPAARTPRQGRGGNAAGGADGQRPRRGGANGAQPQAPTQQAPAQPAAQ